MAERRKRGGREKKKKRNFEKEEIEMQTSKQLKCLKQKKHTDRSTKGRVRG
jgi:hypothetical protein